MLSAIIGAAQGVPDAGQSGNRCADEFVRVKDGHFLRNGEPYYFLGTNMWYGPILASTGQGGNRGRLCRELDSLHALGLDNLRILVGADGDSAVAKVQPVLQRAPGVYNDTLLQGLDYLLSEMGKRSMTAVLYLNNTWEWSGGYSYYLNQSGHGRAPVPAVDGYDKFVSYCAQFATDTLAQRLFYDHVRFILSRTNSYTGLPYKDDPAIMSWQIGNEPRSFSREALPAFEDWLRRTAALIRSLDPNHLISVGSEGKYGCEGDIRSYERICSDPDISYCNIHVWPVTWRWARRDSLMEDIPNACRQSQAYINEHAAICRRLRKPLVIEEFGYPRDGFRFSPSAPTTARDSYYQFMFNQLESSIKEGGPVCGVNFWAWGGEAVPVHTWWQRWDPYTGDPAQEQQGLYSVFQSDRSTLSLIREVAQSVANKKRTGR